MFRAAATVADCRATRRDGPAAARGWRCESATDRAEGPRVLSALGLNKAN